MFRDCNGLIGPMARSRGNLQNTGSFLLGLLTTHFPTLWNHGEKTGKTVFKWCPTQNKLFIPYG